MPLNIGFSVGCLHTSGLNNIASIEAIRKTGCRAIELSFLRLKDFTEDNLAHLPVPRLLENFNYISLHAPIHGYGYDAISRSIFRDLERLHRRSLRLNLVVFHPDTVQDFGVFRELEVPFGFENMDNRKKSFRGAYEMAELLKIVPDAKFIFDVNHLWSNDPTMESAGEFYRFLGSRLAQIHLSGYSGGHVPIHVRKQVRMLNAIQDSDVPIIIESVMPPEDLIKELRYVEKYMLRKR